MAKKSEAKSSSVVGRKSLEPKSSPDSTESRPTSVPRPREREMPLAHRMGDGLRVREQALPGGCRADGLPRPSDGRGIKGEGRPSSILDTRVIYCGDNLEQLAKRSHKVIVALTVQEILDEHIAKKLA